MVMRVVGLVVLLVGCNAREDACEVAFAPQVHTVLTARWTSPSPGPSWAEYELDGEVVTTPVIEDGTRSHQANFLGLASLEEVAWTLFTDGDEPFSCSGVTSTENLPPQSSGLDVTTYNEDLIDPAGYF